MVIKFLIPQPFLEILMTEDNGFLKSFFLHAEIRFYISSLQYEDIIFV